MKKMRILICFVLLAGFVSTTGFSYIFKPGCKQVDDSYLIFDSDKTDGLPYRFRIDEKNNISGSAQFTPPELSNIIAEINESDITVADLRQETHGFVNDYALRLFSLTAIINKNCFREQVLKQEKSYFGSIKSGDKVNVYSRGKQLKETLTAATSFTEEQLAKERNIGYVLFPVQDASIPVPQVVDDFVSFVLCKPDNMHIHFHCRAGEGRTTTFMSMFQIMNNNDGMSLESILEYQQSIGGINLTGRPSRAEFLENFYSYVNENKDGGYKVSYSKWKEVR